MVLQMQPSSVWPGAEPLHHQLHTLERRSLGEAAGPARLGDGAFQLHQQHDCSAHAGSALQLPAAFGWAAHGAGGNDAAGRYDAGTKRRRSEGSASEPDIAALHQLRTKTNILKTILHLMSTRGWTRTEAARFLRQHQAEQYQQQLQEQQQQQQQQQLLQQQQQQQLLQQQQQQLLQLQQARGVVQFSSGPTPTITLPTLHHCPQPELSLVASGGGPLTASPWLSHVEQSCTFNIQDAAAAASNGLAASTLSLADARQRHSSALECPVQYSTVQYMPPQLPQQGGRRGAAPGGSGTAARAHRQH